ncbi:MAG: GC-type dockerin domain-anchored protein [Phycisphaerales bacterium JB039]
MLTRPCAVVIALAGLAVPAAPAAAADQIVTFEFPPRLSGPVALDYGFFGTDAVGCRIVETRVFITFTPDPGVDAADLYSGFDVPVILDDPAGSTRIELIGADLGWSGQGTFGYGLSTTDFNGVVRAGRFGWEIRSVDELRPMSGNFLDNSRIEFVVRCACYADCDESGSLDLFDFLCFQNQFGAGDPAADCDGSGVLDLFDFLCFQNEFAAGCP